MNVPGLGELNFGGHSEIQDIAEQYMAEQGVDYQRPETYRDINPDLSAQIAWEYE